MMANNPESINERIEAESGSSDYDSNSIISDSDLTSIASSVYNYEYENGRRYHAYKAGNYILPNDEKEQERLDIMHHVFRLTLDGNLCRTELKNPGKILDVGTGTGIWAIQVGDDLPSAEVIGTDLSPIQPTWVPPNVRFQIDDASQEWAFPRDSFDFIHVRCLAGSIRDWPAFLQQCMLHLKPGGKIELSEGRTHMVCDDGTFPDDCHTVKWIDEFHAIARRNGLDFDLFPQFSSMLDNAGFVNIESCEKPCPIGTWPKDKRLKEIGKFFRFQFLEAAVDSYSLALFTRLGGWSEAEVQILLAHVREEIKGNKMHVYTHCSYITAEKPIVTQDEK